MKNNENNYPEPSLEEMYRYRDGDYKPVPKSLIDEFYDNLDSDLEEEFGKKFEFDINSIQKTETEVVEEIIKSIYVSPNEVSIDEDAILKTKSEDGYSVTSTLGNILTIVGKPKSRKTIFLSLLIASLIKGNRNNDTFKVQVPESRRTILLFDTEQSKTYARLTYSRVSGIVKGEDISNILVFSLREYSPSERLNYIEKIINFYIDAYLIIIDGIRDLVTDVNHIVESTTLTSTLLRWSAKKNVHIINRHYIDLISV